MTTPNQLAVSPTAQILVGFVAGFIATLIFHQLAVAVLWWLQIAPGPPYQMAPRPPFGVPAVFSLAFWGGVWGILYAWCDRWFSRGAGYWVTAFVVGAILPSLVALLIVLPIKGGPLGAHWNPRIWMFAFLVNGCWGLGTGILVGLGRGLFTVNRRNPIKQRR